ncbi:hypothetical protein GCM10028827_23530 [Mucilaginibacter myungsuensis]
MAFRVKNAPISISRVVTPLGEVKCGLNGNPSSCEISEQVKYENGFSTIMVMPNYEVELISFQPPCDRPQSQYVTMSTGWLWRIQKLTDAVDPIELYCRFTPKRNQEIVYDTACVESLDAVEIYDKDWRIHIGTEDGEALHYRALKNDGFPSRLNDIVSVDRSIVIRNQFGFNSFLPHLNKGEHLHMHLLWLTAVKLTKMLIHG